VRGWVAPIVSGNLRDTTVEPQISVIEASSGTSESRAGAGFGSGMKGSSGSGAWAGGWIGPGSGEDPAQGPAVLGA